jgi:hypothetical protein
MVERMGSSRRKPVGVGIGGGIGVGVGIGATV